jgi:hypothetical protein
MKIQFFFLKIVSQNAKYDYDWKHNQELAHDSDHIREVFSDLLLLPHPLLLPFPPQHCLRSGHGAMTQVQP